MESKIIGIKQLHKDLSIVADAVAQGQSYTVVRHSKPVFKIEPISDQQEDSKKKMYTLKDLKKLRFSHPDKNLSLKIDELLYGL